MTSPSHPVEGNGFTFTLPHAVSINEGYPTPGIQSSGFKLIKLSHTETSAVFWCNLEDEYSVRKHYPSAYEITPTGVWAKGQNEKYSVHQGVWFYKSTLAAMKQGSLIHPDALSATDIGDIVEILYRLTQTYVEETHIQLFLGVSETLRLGSIFKCCLGVLYTDDDILIFPEENFSTLIKTHHLDRLNPLTPLEQIGVTRLLLNQLIESILI